MKNELITKEYSSGIKGWMCIGVLLHHLSMFSGLFASTYFGHFLNLLGSWTVGVFLFLSGYGLFCSYSQKGDSYIRGFFKHRFLPLYISYLVGVLIYLIYDFKTLTPLKLLTSLTWGGTIISFGWFFQFLFLMYLVFWAVFRFCGNKVARSIILGVFFTVYLFGAHLLGAHDVPVVCFACGIIMGVYRDRLSRFFDRHAVILTAIFFGIFFSLYLVYVNGVIMGKFPVGYVLLSSVIGISDLAIIGFVISVSHICLKKNIPLIVNPAIALFAEFSLAIYMIQGLCIRFLYERFESSLVYFFAAFFLTLVAAIPLHYLLKLINSGYRKLFRL